MTVRKEKDFNDKKKWIETLCETIYFSMILYHDFEIINGMLEKEKVNVKVKNEQ